MQGIAIVTPQAPALTALPTKPAAAPVEQIKATTAANGLARRATASALIG